MNQEKVTEELVRQNGNQAAAVMADFAGGGGQEFEGDVIIQDGNLGVPDGDLSVGGETKLSGEVKVGGTMVLLGEVHGGAFTPSHMRLPDEGAVLSDTADGVEYRLTVTKGQLVLTPVE